MKYLIFILTTLVFTGCSFKTVPNKWEHTAHSATLEFTQNFLKGHDLVALNDYKRAVDNAKMSADLTSLAIIELTNCALNTIVGNPIKCKKFEAIESLVHSNQFSSYNYFISNKLTKDTLASLDDKYQRFAQALLAQQPKEALIQMQQNKNLVSKLLMAALIKDSLSQEDIKELITLCSFHGYKKATLFWLKFNYDKFHDETSLQTLNILLR